MTWDVKYRCEFTDILNLDWKIDIEDETAASTITTMQATGNPLEIEYLSPSDDLFSSHVRGSKADLAVESSVDFEWLPLYATEDLQWRMSIYHGATLFWRGFIITDNYSEPYDTTVYPVTISASDGLGVLKNMLYKYQTTAPDDTYYNGRIKESQIILDILGKIGFIQFTEFVNIYVDSILQTVNDSVFNQVEIDVDVFKDFYCYDVLEEILKKYNALIRQVNGEFVIYRVIELHDETMYGRIFTSAQVKTSTTLTPAQYISRIINVSDIKDLNGGTLTGRGGSKKVTINHDYGDKASWLDNYELKGETFTVSSLEFDGWTNTGGEPVGWYIPGEPDGVIIPGTTSIPCANNITQTIGTNALTSETDVFGIEFDYLLYNSYAAGLVPSMYIEIQTANHWLKWAAGDEYCTWSDTQAYITINFDSSTILGSNGWVFWSYQVVGLPDDGTLTVTLFGTYHASQIVRAAWKNIRFFTTSNEVVITKRKRKLRQRFSFKGGLGFGEGQLSLKNKYFYTISTTENDEIVEKEYTRTNDINGSELIFDTVLGDASDPNIDNVIEQFKGGLGYTVAQIRVDTVQLDSGALGTGNSVITCNGVSGTASKTSLQSLTTVAENFVSTYESTYLANADIVLTNSSGTLIFTSIYSGVDFTGNTTATGTTPDLHGHVSYFTPAYGTLLFTTDWNTRGGNQSTYLLQIICNEIAGQYSRPKQMLRLPVWEDDTVSNTPHINVMGCFHDERNTVDGANRVFGLNQGLFNVRERTWELGLIEVLKYSGDPLVDASGDLIYDHDNVLITI